MTLAFVAGGRHGDCTVPPMTAPAGDWTAANVPPKVALTESDRWRGMKLGFEEVQLGYTSGSQKARVWTEQWVSQQLYCPNCGNPQITQLPANLPVADFFCPKCNDQFELKSQKKDFGAKVADGAYHTKCERLVSSTNPNLLLLSYDLADAAVRNVSVVPKHFFVPDIVERRKPLADTGRRAGWIGSNILLGKVPQSGRMMVPRGVV